MKPFSVEKKAPLPLNQEEKEGSRAPVPSTVVLPLIDPPYPSILDFLDNRFIRIGRQVWQERIEAGKIFLENGEPVNSSTPYKSLSKLYYYREVPKEPPLKEKGRILFKNDHLLVAYKPHFQPVTPSGSYINRCLLYQLMKDEGLKDLAPLHRLDRETAGLVLFSLNPCTRSLYHDLFSLRKVRKIYEAITGCPEKGKEMGIIENRIVRGDPWFLSRIVPGEVNSRTHIEIIKKGRERALFRLFPVTGKKHQLRLHMAHWGLPILNDPFYPALQPQKADNPLSPLQLLARSLAFKDPVTGQTMIFECKERLLFENF